MKCLTTPTLERGWGGEGESTWSPLELDCTSPQQAEQAPSDHNKNLGSGVFPQPCSRVCLWLVKVTGMWAWV